ncbi:MAG: hypothetical protein ACREM2_03570, partial [Vulcanimicrobiaceae bacterium]
MSNEAPREPHGLFVERFRLEATPHGYRLERRGVPQPSAPADRVARPAAPWLFVGRSAELEAARDVLRDGAMRGIVFYGARGCGKTTFLQALANDPGFAERFDAIAFVSACGQPLDDVLVLLNRALCEASDERFVPADGRWLAQLGSRRVALLIDDAEPPFDFDPIVRAAPGITLVATACEPPSHPALRTCEFSPLAGDDGVTLLGAVLGVEPNPRDAALMLCQSLRGNPGRIAQAAALCASTGIALEELARQLLSEATLDDALDARVALLDSDHRRLFDALALFGEPAISLSDPLLRELAESGLIVRDERGWCPSAGLGRRYGAARIDDESFGSTLVSARGRFLAAVEQLADPMHLLPSLAALRRAESLGRNEDAIVLGCAVADAFARTGAWRQWLGALEFVQRSAKRAGRAEDEAWALHQIGTRAAALGDIVGGMGTLRTALAMREEAGDRAAVAVTRHNVG